MKQFRYRDNVGRYEYPVITTSALDLLIRTEGQICRNQQSTYESHGGRGDCQQKDARDTLFLSNNREESMEAPNKMHHWFQVRTELI